METIGTPFGHRPDCTCSCPCDVCVVDCWYPDNPPQRGADSADILARTVRDGGCTLDSRTFEPVSCPCCPAGYLPCPCHDTLPFARGETPAGHAVWTVGGDTRPAASFAYSPDDALASSRLADALCRVLGSYDDDPYRPAYIGTWIDDGTVYVDAVSLHSSREDALAVAYARGEAAVYNLATGETVRHGESRPA